MIFNKKTTLFTTITLLFIIVSAFKRDEKKQMVCFGDSITYGAKVDGHSWVSFLNENHPEISFVNTGRSGRKTSDKKELLPVLEKYPNANSYLIFLGVNDLKDGNDSLENVCVANMQWMIDEIRKVNGTAEIVILSPCNINLKTMDDVNVKKKYNQNTQNSLKHLKKKYHQLAKKNQIGFISLFKAVSKPNYADGLHPNLKGQEEISKTVWRGLN